MTARHTPEVLIARDEIVAAPAPRACEDQSFELPGGLYAAMTVMFAGFIIVLGSAFRGGHMAVAYGVIFAFLAAFFAIPAMFQRKRGLSWGMFRYKGIQTATGRTSAREATILVLLLPFLILCFAIAVATIASLV
jgi:hypothetical protein